MEPCGCTQPLLYQIAPCLAQFCISHSEKKNALQDAGETSLKQWLKNDVITQTRFSDQEFLQEIESRI